MTTHLEDVIEDLALDLREIVAAIESSTPITQNHYGRYLSIITIQENDSRMAKIMALALIAAGANRAGVMAALKVAGFD